MIESGEKQTVFVQRSTTVGVFAFFMAAFVGLAWLIFPVLFTQAKAVLLRVEETNIQAEADKLLDRTIGGYLYQRQFGKAQPTEFQKLVDEHEAGENAGLGMPVAVYLLNVILHGANSAVAEDAHVRTLDTST